MELLRCAACGKTSLEAPFTASSAARRMCGLCRRMRWRDSVCGSDARRLLYNLKQYCRAHGLEDGACWTMSDMEKLVAAWQPSGSFDKEPVKPRTPLVRLDPTRPWVPGNVAVRAFGVKKARQRGAVD